ncbi:MAG: formate dehydrogenase [Alphaproteobacteria bacterium]|nr:formate dehydrogenase [Alphaproteobacteria bacterium]
MKTERLVRQANQIAEFFKSAPETEAVAGTLDHMRKFWDPRMRTQIVVHLDAGGAGLNAIARQAVVGLRPPQPIPSNSRVER